MDTERWSAAVWPFVRSRLPASPATVLELGCGSAGGFVPRLRESGYDAAGIDPNAPAAPGFHQIGFEQFEPEQPVDAIVASRSLHHVGGHRRDGRAHRRSAPARRDADRRRVGVGAVRRGHRASGASRGSTARLPTPTPGGFSAASTAGVRPGEAWETYFIDWATGHGLVRADRILAEFDGHFEPALCSYGPYFFADLAGVSEREEQAAIDARRDPRDRHPLRRHAPSSLTIRGVRRARAVRRSARRRPPRRRGRRTRRCAHRDRG